MTPIAPPPLNAIHDALAVIRLAVNPQQAQELIETLRAETESHAQTLAAIRGRDDQLNLREKSLAVRERRVAEAQDKLATRETQVSAREMEVGARASSLEQQAGEHGVLVQTTAQSHSDRESAIRAEEDRLASVRRSQEQTYASRLAAIEEQEKYLASQIQLVEQKHARIREIAS